MTENEIDLQTGWTVAQLRSRALHVLDNLRGRIGDPDYVPVLASDEGPMKDQVEELVRLIPAIEAHIHQIIPAREGQ